MITVKFNHKIPGQLYPGDLVRKKAEENELIVLVSEVFDHSLQFTGYVLRNSLGEVPGEVLEGKYIGLYYDEWAIKDLYRFDMREFAIIAPRKIEKREEKGILKPGQFRGDKDTFFHILKNDGEGEFDVLCYEKEEGGVWTMRYEPICTNTDLLSLLALDILSPPPTITFNEQK